MILKIVIFMYLLVAVMWNIILFQPPLPNIISGHMPSRMYMPWRLECVMNYEIVWPECAAVGLDGRVMGLWLKDPEMAWKDDPYLEFDI